MPTKAKDETSETTGARTSAAITETGPPADEAPAVNKQESLSALRDAEEARLKETIRAVQSGELVPETSNQRAPTEADKAQQDKVTALQDKGVDVHRGFVRPGDIGAAGSFALGVTSDLADAPAREFQVTEEVLNSPTFRAMGPDNQRYIDHLLMRHPAIVKNDVIAVPLEDPSPGSEQTLTAGSEVPEGLGWVPANYVDRKLRIALD